MKIILSILALVLMVNGCGIKVAKNNTQSNLANNTMLEQEPIIQYTASTRGFYEDIKVDESGIYINKTRGSEDVETKPISEKEWNQLKSILNSVNVKNIANYQAPTTKRFSDGAAIASVRIIYSDTVYASQKFDHGNPPKELTELCKTVLTLSEKEQPSNNIFGSYKVVFMSELSEEDFKEKGLTINFKDNSVSGYNGCNNYRANYSINQDSISVGIMMTTKRYCQDSLQIEGKLMKKLRQAKHFKINDNTLTLLDNDLILIKAKKVIEKK